MADLDPKIAQSAGEDGTASPPAPVAPRLRDRWHRLPLLVRILLTVLGALFALWLILFLTKGRFLKKPFEGIASRMIKREVTVDGDFQLYFAPIGIKFVAEKFKVANTGWASKDHLFAADLVHARLSTFRLILGQRRITWLALRNGDADLEWSRDGRTNTWTLGDPNRKGEPFDMPDIRQGIVTGTTVRYRDPRRQIETDIKVDTVRARDTRFAQDIGFTGTGRMRGRPVSFTGRLLSPNETVAGGRNRLAVSARSLDASATLSGTLPAATQIEGADLSLTVRGANLARLFDIIGVAIPDTRRYRISSALTYGDQAWRFTRLRGLIGESDVAGTLTVTQPGGRLHLGADLATRSLAIVDAGPFIGYNPDRLAAQGMQGAITQVGGTPRILPDAPLRVDAISRFDADVKWTARTIKAPNVPISNIGLTLDLDKSLLKLSPLTFDMAGGHLSSDIVINARKRPVFTDYDIRLSPTPMGKLLNRWGVEESGTSGTLTARIKMTGSGDTVHDSLATSNGRIAVIMPKGTMWARNIQLAEIDIGVFIQKMFEDRLKEPVQINCGLIAFTVKNGIAAADPILIDTTKNVILGRGGFSFRDESIDLALRADGKKFSLFSGQSPVGLNGHFAAPGLAVISPELLTRAGAGVGLGLAASPLAAILAFVDVGDAKSAACGPVLKGTTATAQRTSKGKPRDDVGRGTTAKSESGK
ncbi:AsmA family protein [Sphingobium sufflavum]|uniref:AsmA family protein n=1 Tax=Sphingobium sufflavum TaxID=1129547 RepID=UPI001F3AA9BB|nr:AsmA family protein [Sphingobium sufflavum]MCE7797327.1 AsmA family protein [Sphingobium sufflavum]